MSATNVRTAHVCTANVTTTGMTAAVTAPLSRCDTGCQSQRSKDCAESHAA